LTDLQNPSEIDPLYLRVESFFETPLLQGFTCGNNDLDEFLRSPEVREFEERGLGRTFLAFYEADLVAYYTLSNAGLRTECLGAARPLARSAEGRVDAFPAVKIGRLAVSRSWQRRGIGRYLIAAITAEALFQGRRSGFRLLILEARPESVSFYERCGFRLTRKTARERGKRNRTMFLDLHAIEPLRG